MDKQTESIINQQIDVLLKECGCMNAGGDVDPMKLLRVIKLNSPLPEPEPEEHLVSPDQLNDPEFIANVVKQVLYTIRGSGTSGLDEGSCGYTETPDGKMTKTPGGITGMDALARTNLMRSRKKTTKKKAKK